MLGIHIWNSSAGEEIPPHPSSAMGTLPFIPSYTHPPLNSTCQTLMLGAWSSCDPIVPWAIAECDQNAA